MPAAGTKAFPGLPTATVEPDSAAAAVLILAASAVALGARLALGLVFTQAAPYATFYLATLIVTILAGVRSGFVTALLGYALAGLFVAGTASFTLSSGAYYALVSAAFLWLASQYRRLLREVQQRARFSSRQAELIAQENAALTLIAQGRPTKEVMELLTRSIEEFCDRTLFASILVVDEDGLTLRHCAAPSLPDAYNDAIDGAVIGPKAGSCGTAAFRKTPVIVEDIDQDPLWDDYRAAAQPHGLKACWSTPILSTRGEVLGTFAVYYDEKRGPSEEEQELVHLFVNTASIAIEVRRSLEQRELVTRELAHRMRNLLTIVQSIASGTIGPHVPTAQFEDFSSRLRALGQVQAILTSSPSSTVELGELVRKVVVEPFGRSQRFEVAGPPVEVPPDLSVLFALSLHELCTNACKYGALSVDDGKVAIAWDPLEDKDGHRFRFRWSESGGPPVARPQRTGFGSKMIGRLLAVMESTTGAKGGPRIEYAPEGLKCEFAFSIAN